MSQHQRCFSEGPAGEPGLIQTPAPKGAGAAGAGREGPAFSIGCNPGAV